MAPTRVAFAIPSLSRGGAGNMQGGPEGVFTTLLQRIDHDRFEVQLLIDDRATSNLLDSLDERVTIATLAEHGAALPVQAMQRYPFRRFAKAIRALEPDVVLTTLRMNITGALASRLLPSRTVLVCRVANHLTGTLATVSRTSPKLKQRTSERLHRLVAERADLLVAQSTSMEDDLIRRFGAPVAPRIRRIPNPVDVHALRARAGAAVPKGDREGRPLLVSVGRLHHQKGYDLLLPAFAEVLRRQPEARLRILGEGPDRDALEAQARALGVADHVDLPGFVADPAPFVARADLYVCSSRYEGFSNALAEALAVGTPCVAPDGPAAGAELLTEANGVLVDHASVETLRDGIERALANTYDREAISADCRARFSPDTIVERYEAVLDEAARRVTAR